MSIQVSNDGDMVFGVMVTVLTATHCRFRKVGVDVVVPLTAAVSVAVGERLRIINGMLIVNYPEGDLPDGHMLAVVRPYWLNETFQVDLMTDSTTVIIDSGYMPVQHSVWNVVAV